MIYKFFKIAGQEVSVEFQDYLLGGEYGKFNDARNLITLARTVKVDGEVIKLTKAQIKNTFYHEVIHVFQFYFNNEFDEAQAQVYANFICEMLDSGERVEI